MTLQTAFGLGLVLGMAIGIVTHAVAPVFRRQRRWTGRR